MATFRRGLTGTGQWVGDVDDDAELQNRNFAANQWESGFQAARGMGGRDRAAEIAMARLAADDARMAQEREDRLGDRQAQLALAKMQMERGDIASKAQMDFMREQLAAQERRDKEVWERGAPERDRARVVAEAQAALAAAQLEREKALLKRMTAAGEKLGEKAGLGETAGIADDPDVLTLIESGTSPGAAIKQVEEGRKEKTKKEAAAVAEGKAAELMRRVKSFSDRDNAYFTADPTMADVNQLVSEFNDLVKTYVEAGMPRSTAISKARDIIDAGTGEGEYGWDWTLRQAVGNVLGDEGGSNSAVRGMASGAAFSTLLNDTLRK